MVADTTQSSAFDIDLAGARLLLVTPHPDDESLALGGLIQQAIRQGGDITLLQVTDGDNNPWPQRWLERRWRIGPAERRRWGRRRVDEVGAAIRCLGLPVAALRRLGWPDMGVTRRLYDSHVEALDAFAEVVRGVDPDIVVMPDLGDHHPDHGASHVLSRLVLAKLQRRPTCLTYLVHGRPTQAGQSCVLALNPAMQEAKRRAILAHRTQVAMARRRLLAMAGPDEHLYRLQSPEYAQPGALPGVVALPWHPPRGLQPWLQLTLVHLGGVHSWSWREAPLQRCQRGWQLRLSGTMMRRPVFAKLEMRCKSPWIFDHWGWCDLTAATAEGQASG